MENKPYRIDKGVIQLSRQTDITQWLMQCPQLASIYNISAEEQDGANVIFPIGTSKRRNIIDNEDILGAYEAEIEPLPSVYEEYQINCYKSLANSDNMYNVMRIDEVEAVMDWLTEQDKSQNFPQIGECVIAVEPIPFIPQIRFADPVTGIVCYYITLRITYVNSMERRTIRCQT